MCCSFCLSLRVAHLSKRIARWVWVCSWCECEFVGRNYARAREGLIQISRAFSGLPVVWKWFLALPCVFLNSCSALSVVLLCLCIACVWYMFCGIAMGCSLSSVELCVGRLSAARQWLVQGLHHIPFSSVLFSEVGILRSGVRLQHLIEPVLLFLVDCFGATIRASRRRGIGSRRRCTLQRSCDFTLCVCTCFFGICFCVVVVVVVTDPVHSLVLYVNYFRCSVWFDCCGVCV